MTAYKQLTREQRYQISVLKSAAHSQSQIAQLLGVHKSTICRELRRNSLRRNIYGPRQAHDLATKRRLAKARPKVTSQTWQQVESLLKLDWSPEQIVGRLRYEQQGSVSHEAIYRYIYADKTRGGTLYQNLRCRKLRRKRYASSKRRIPILNRKSIELRPKIVEQKSRLGDWEADTIIGRGHCHALVSIVERKSKLTLLKKVEANTADQVAAASLALLRPIKDLVHTITSDNGREFCAHQRISTGLQAKFYVADPYSSWQRGLNENTNGLVRQYFPKKADFTAISDTDVKRVAEKLNHRPRKSLGYRTPHEVFFKRKVALTS